jgi:hypothetical protein
VLLTLEPGKTSISELEGQTFMKSFSGAFNAKFSVLGVRVEELIYIQGGFYI